jgi:ubiquinone/menaquinone biosynthesis C-methylase UbiE
VQNEYARVVVIAPGIGSPVMKNSMKELDYILGHSPREIERLIQQADIIRPITERLLMRLNIGPGARVLDLGSGAGDVSMLVAELVGPTGRVIGIDQNAEVLAIAAERASEADLSHIVFEHASLESFPTTESFDLVIGRYVLLHQADPIGFLCHLQLNRRLAH